MQQELAIDGDVALAVVTVVTDAHRAVARHLEHAEVTGHAVLLAHLAGADRAGFHRRPERRDIDEGTVPCRQADEATVIREVVIETLASSLTVPCLQGHPV